MGQGNYAHTFSKPSLLMGDRLRGDFPRMFIHQVLEENWAKIKLTPYFISLHRLGHGLDFTIISEHYYTAGSNGQHSD